MRYARCRPGRSAVWPLPTTRISAPATSSNASTSKPSPGRSRGLLVLQRGSARGRADPFSHPSFASMRKHHSGKTTGPSQRQLRVGELVRHALAELLARGEIHDEVLASHVLTIPEVRMSPDLRQATIFVMPLGGKDIEAVLTALESNRRYIRGEVARAVNLKFAPELRFRADQSFDEALRIDRLLASDQVSEDLDKR